MRKGDTVEIEGRERVLVRRLETPRGWEVDRPVNGFKWWSEDDMRRVEKEVSA